MKQIEGFTITGEERLYGFHLMDAKTGLEIWHKYGEKLAFSIPSDLSEDKAGRLMFAWTILKSIPFDEILVLAEKMLAGAYINIVGEQYTAGKDGLGKWCQGAPDELYTALVYAAFANYEKVLESIIPFLREIEEAAETESEDTDSTLPNTPPSTEAEKSED